MVGPINYSLNSIPFVGIDGVMGDGNFGEQCLAFIESDLFGTLIRVLDPPIMIEFISENTALLRN